MQGCFPENSGIFHKESYLLIICFHESSLIRISYGTYYFFHRIDVDRRSTFVWSFKGNNHFVLIKRSYDKRNVEFVETKLQYITRKVHTVLFQKFDFEIPPTARGTNKKFYTHFYDKHPSDTIPYETFNRFHRSRKYPGYAFIYTQRVAFVHNYYLKYLHGKVHIPLKKKSRSP